jgi:hypothetical protein
LIGTERLFTQTDCRRAPGSGFEIGKMARRL